MPTATAVALNGQRRRLPNELLSELVDCLPMAQFIIGDDGVSPHVPRYGASREWAMMLRSVALTTYLARVGHKYKKAAIKESVEKIMAMCKTEEQWNAAVAAMKKKAVEFGILEEEEEAASPE